MRTYPSGCEISESVESDRVVGLDFVVVSLVGKSKRKHSLLLQVRFVDTSKRLGDDGGAAQKSGTTISVFQVTYQVS